MGDGLKARSCELAKEYRIIGEEKMAQDAGREGPHGVDGLWRASCRCGVGNSDITKEGPLIVLPTRVRQNTGHTKW